MTRIYRSHVLGKELLNRPNSFIVARVGQKEYIIDSIHRIGTYANSDDMSIYLALQLKECNGENIKR